MTTARQDRPQSHKWMVLSNTTLGMLAAAINGSILLISLPAVFRGIGLKALDPGNINYLLWAIIGYMIATAVLVVAFAFGPQEQGHGPRGPHKIVQRLASAPIGKLAPALGMTGKEAIARLEKSGIAVDGPEQSLTDIATKQHERLPRLIEVVLADPED